MAFTADQMERYGRHFVLSEIGAAGQKKLLKSRVLVVGSGGLGAPLIQYLAAAGIGTIGIVDHDVVELSNLQRQIVHSTHTLGHQKTASSAQFVERLNPDVNVIQHSVKMTEDNVDSLITPYDIIADCTDNFGIRFIIHDACFKAHKTLVQAAAIQMSGQLSVYKPHEAENLPCYRCLLPKPPMGGFVPTCATGGILGAVTGVMGAWQSIEIIKEILGLGESLAGRLVIFDALTGVVRNVRLPRDPECPMCRCV